MKFIIVLIFSSFLGVSYAGNRAHCEPLESQVLELSQLLERVLASKKNSLIVAASGLSKHSPEPMRNVSKVELTLFKDFAANITGKLANIPGPLVLQAMLGSHRYPHKTLDCIIDILIGINDLIDRTLVETLVEIEKIQTNVEDISNLTCVEKIAWFKAIDENDFKRQQITRSQYLAYQSVAFAEYPQDVLNMLMEIQREFRAKSPYFEWVAGLLSTSYEATAFLFTGNNKNLPEVLECLKVPLLDQYKDAVKDFLLILENAKKLVNGC